MNVKFKRLLICLSIFIPLFLLTQILTETRYNVDLKQYQYGERVPRYVDSFTFCKYQCIKKTSVCFLLGSNKNLDEAFLLSKNKSMFVDEIIHRLDNMLAPAKWGFCDLPSDCTITEDYCGFGVAVNKHFYYISSVWYPRVPLSCLGLNYVSESVFSNELACIQNKCTLK